MGNVITGVFVESAMSKARSDNEFATHEEMIKKEDVMKHLMRVFKKMDGDKSGSVDYLEWENFTTKLESQALFALHGLDVSQTSNVFKLIDWDESGEIELDEFVIGCMQLQGGAKVLDIESLMRNQKKLYSKFSEKIIGVEKLIDTSMTELKSYLYQIFRNNAPDFPEDNERAWV